MTRLVSVLGYMHAEADPDCNILPMTCGIWINVEVCTLEACIHRLACCAISASAEVLVCFNCAMCGPLVM